MVALGLPDFGPVQNNVSFNADRGVDPRHPHRAVGQVHLAGHRPDLRRVGRHARGRDLRRDLHPRDRHRRSRSSCRAASATATRRSRTRRPTPTSSTTTGVPGVTYPALAPRRPDRRRSPWPIPLDEAIISEKDQNNPRLGDVVPRWQPKKTLIVGALRPARPAPCTPRYPDADRVDLFEGDGVTALDLTDADAVAAWPWHEYAVVLNAAAYTAVDAAETTEGRVAAWAANATGPATLARPGPRAPLHARALLLGVRLRRHRRRSTPATPRTSRCRRSGVYAQSKAAGDLAVGLAPRHYLLRTSWVIGEGKNFVRTMQVARREGRLAQRRRRPGRPADLHRRAGPRDRGTCSTPARAFGTYNVSNGGAADVVARDRPGGLRALRPQRATTSPAPARRRTPRGCWRRATRSRPRPLNSAMSLEKIRATGFEPEDALVALDRYLA